MAKNLTQKELEQPDEFHTIGWYILEYISEHRKQFYAGGAAVLLIIILLGAWYFHHLNYESNAESVYAKAYNSYALPGTSGDMKDAYLKASQIYENLVEEYPDSNAAVLSYYNMGNIYFTIDETDKSIESYKTFLKKTKKDDILIALAYYGLGYCYEKKEDYENALKSFENSNKLMQGTQFESINYANMGRIYEKMGKQKEALELYQKTVEEINDPLMEMLIKSRIVALS
ncbi:MAG TPA: tetratricopeptide repeat protein [Syntrophales bacterium]|nr:tetratricopeptide repeat protein [Syntrophales bacterium]HPQ45322.1 tetratricopeptide repeat protein [Syntrophales bacterium]